MTQKVLFTASTFSHILNFHIPYLKWFHDQGWTVHVACGGKPAEIPHADRVITLPFQKNMFSPENFKAARMLRKLIQTEQYALISTHTSLAAFFTRLAVKGMRNRPKVVYICHGYLFDDGTPGLKRTILTAAERMTAGETDLLLTMNEWDYSFATAHRLGKRVANIPGMGVDFTKYDSVTPGDGKTIRQQHNIPQNAFVFIYPAEFSPRKSQRVIIEAMAKLPDNVYLLLPGQGALLEECRKLAERTGVAGRVIFPGQISNMAPWYAASDAAVTASRSEGLPFNVMEAMYCGLPVAASAVKGHTDLIQNGETGLLYPYGDADALAGTLRTLLSFPSLCARLGAAAKASARQYALTNVLHEVLRVTLSVLDPQ